MQESQLIQKLRDHDLKVTWQRLEVLKLLNATNKHYDAEQIYMILRRRKKNVSRATVYRSLDTLVEQGLVDRVDFGDGRMHFECASEDDEHHDHMICSSCGKVIEFYNIEIEALQLAICREHGFMPTEHTLHIYGLCADCQREPKNH